MQTLISSFKGTKGDAPPRTVLGLVLSLLPLPSERTPGAQEEAFLHQDRRPQETFLPTQADAGILDPTSHGRPGQGRVKGLPASWGKPGWAREAENMTPGPWLGRG